MEERIQKIISAAGVTSRRAAEELIAEGRVRVNGQVVTELGTKADPSKDHIKVDGKLINPKQPQTYIMLNKPAGFVTTMSDPEGRPTVQDLLKGVKVRVYPVGRLDYNTEGMLILTNDGDFAHLVTHPKHELPKTYLAKIKGVLDERQIENIETGLFLDDGKTAPAKLKKIRKEEANSWVEITITEGRKRQVRRMFDRVGRSVIKLKRIKTGNLVLGDLPEGTFRYLTPVEVKGLMDLSQKTEVKPLIPAVIRKPAAIRKEISPVGVRGAGPREVRREATGSRIQRPEYKGQRTVSRGRNESRPTQYGGRPPRTATKVMQDTSEGRRYNQVVRPHRVSEDAEGKGSASRPLVDRTREDRDQRSTTGASFRRPAPAASGNRETRRIPAQRAWSSNRGTESRGKGSGYESRGEGRKPGFAPRTARSSYPSKGPGSAPIFAQRGDRSYKPAEKPLTSRPTTRTGTGRPVTAAAVWKSEGRRKPDQRPWPSTRSSETRGKGTGTASGYRTQGDRGHAPVARAASSRPAPGAAGWKPQARKSGPRPNKSTYTGSKGPGRRTGPGSRGTGQGASGRGPRR